MANYDDYRFNPQASGPSFSRGGPGQVYANSSSLWGNSFGGAKGVAALAGGPMAMAPALLYGLSRSHKAKGEQEDAEAENNRRWDQWRGDATTQGRDQLMVGGTDVYQDLSGEYNAALDGQDPNAIQDKLTQFQQRYQQYMLGRQRAGQARQVDAQFSDPGRRVAREQRIGAERTKGLSDIADQYKIGQRYNAFNQARRGMQGGSTDVEQQGQLGRSRDLAAGGLQAGLDAKMQQYSMQDQEQRNQLMGLIYSDDPNTAAAYSRTLEGIGKQGQLVNEQQAVGVQRDAANSAAQRGYSQAFGGLLSSASRPLEYYIDHRGGGA